MIYIEINGEPVPAKDVVWIERASCGCICGASFENFHATSEDEMITTAAQFARRDTPRAVWERAAQDGFTQEPMTDAMWDNASESLKHLCPHEPKFGRYVAPIPDGYVWATSDRWYGRRTYKRHLVTKEEAPARREDSRRTTFPYVPALCGSRSKQFWSSDTSDVHETVTCRKCETKAQEMAAAGILGGVS